MPEQLSLWNFGGSRRPAPSPTDCVRFMAYPDAGDAARIARLAEELRREHSLNSPALAADRLHVSLHCLGHVSGEPPADLVSALQDAASEVAMAPFDVSFDRTVSFRRSGKRPFVRPRAAHSAGAPSVARLIFKSSSGEPAWRTQ